MSIGLRNIHWFDGETELPASSLLITENGVQVVDQVPSGVEQIDCEGCWLLPALAELHADFRQPGLEHIYSFNCGIQAMVRGGYSTVLLTPQTNPVIDQPSVVELVRRQVERRPVDLRIAAALSRELAGTKLPELVEMHNAGASAFSTGLSALPTTRFLRLALSYAMQTDCRVHLFPLEADWSQELSFPEGPVADLYGLSGKPECAETIAVFRILEVVRSLRTPVHLKHLTLPASISMALEAREQGFDVTFDLPILNLLFDEEDLDGLDTSLHLNPPLRSSAVRSELLRVVREGKIKVLSSQHIPVLPENKNDHFAASHPGAVGLESAFALVVQLLGGWSGETMRRSVQLLSDGPRKVLGIGRAKDLNEWMVWSPNVERVLSAETFAGAVANTPLLGEKVKGVCRGIVVRGEWMPA